jgi:AcrR family transcriptional regulator
MTMDAIADRAEVGKTIIYRRYASKEELVVNAIESIRSEIVIPDTGNLQSAIVLYASKQMIAMAKHGCDVALPVNSHLGLFSLTGWMACSTKS